MDKNKYFTFTEEDNYTLEKIFSCLDSKVLEVLSEKIFDYRDEIISCMYDCQSPIEQLMAMHLHCAVNSPYIIIKAEELLLDIVGIIPQSYIKCGDKTYKADFEISVWDKKTQEGKYFVIECDGHNFHEKTKEQARRDKERERDLIKLGKIVIRFSGSEIYKKADECAREVCDIIFNHYKNESR